MKARLRGISGPATGLEVALQPGPSVSVGRSPECTVPLAADAFLSGRHFEVAVSDEGIVLRDLGSRNGTFLDGVQIQERVLIGGESFRAGQSSFVVELGEAIPHVLDVLSGQSEPLYAVLDAARDPAIFPLLLTSGAQYGQLYSGESALKLEAVGPYLAYLPPRCELLQTIVEKGWGNAWGIFLTSSQPMETIWHELRRSLMVTLETTGKMAYFRFYDPRVLRTFLPVADPQQRVQLFGTISSFLLEAKDATTLLRFAAGSNTRDAEALTVRAPAKKPAGAGEPPTQGPQATRVFKIGG